METSNFTSWDKKTIRGLCRYPWDVDREIAQAEGILNSTTTACKNKLKKNQIFHRYYIAPYYQLDFPLVSFSKYKLAYPPEIGLETILKDKFTRTIVLFAINDPINAFILACHQDYTQYKKFQQSFGSEWVHDLQVFNGSQEMVNFNFTNIINRVFFPEDIDAYKLKKVEVSSYKFINKTNKRAFYGFIQNPDLVPTQLEKSLKITRQSLVNIKNKLREVGLLDRTVIMNLEEIGIFLLSIIKIQLNNASSKVISKIHEILKPFYYRIFDDIHIIITGHQDYGDLVEDLEQAIKTKSSFIMDIQLFDISKSEIYYGFDKLYDI